MGGIVAFEMARLLRSQGHEVGPVAMLDSYNLNAVQVERSLYSRLDAARQKAFFHFENLRQMSFAEKSGYFREKFRMLIEMIRQKLTPRPGATPGDPAKARAEQTSLASIQDINHHAGWNHVPGKYDGHLMLFKPHKNYDFFPDPDMGWQRQVSGQIERVELTANPHAMLIVPSVAKLAVELKARIALHESSGKKQSSHATVP